MLNFEEVSDSFSEVSDDKLKGVSVLADRILQLQREVEEAEEALRLKKEELRRVQEGELPELMDSLMMEEFKLNTGEKIKVESLVTASIKSENKERAFEWLVSNGHGSLIKTEVKIAFGRGDRTKAEELTALLKTKGFVPEVKQAVHPMSLSAFAREQLGLGMALPVDLLGVYVGRKAKITKG